MKLVYRFINKIKQIIMSIDKKQAQKELKELQKRVDSLTAIINAPKNVFDITTYEDVCEELQEKQLGITDFSFLPKEDRKKALDFAKIKQLERFYNGDWKADWTNYNQNKYYPYFETLASCGFRFGASHCCLSSFEAVPCYFKDEKTSSFVGKTYINIYKDLI